jgi:hypothetical protein
MDWTTLVDSLNAGVLTAFGREVVYTPQAGAPVTIRAAVQEGRRSEETSPGTYALMFLRLAALPQPPERGDQIEIDSGLYTVFEIEADGEGGVTLAARLK